MNNIRQIVKRIINEMTSNEKALYGIIDTLSNSMEYFEDKEEFVKFLNDDFKNDYSKEFFSMLWDDYWKLGAFDRNDFLRDEWEDFIEEIKIKLS